MGKSRKSTRLTAAACASALELLEQRAMFSVAEPNNTFATAVAVNDGRAAGGSFTFTDFINDADPVDFFRLTNRGTPSHFGVGLRDPDGDLSLSLISDTNGNGVEDAGDQVITSANGGTLNETIQANLIPGDYFLKVFSAGPGNATVYTLDMVNDQAGADATRGDSPLFLGAFGSQTVDEGFAGNDIVDTYAFFIGDGREANGTFAARLIAGTGGANYHVDLMQDSNKDGVITREDTIIASAHVVDGAAVIQPITLANNGNTYFLRIVQSVGAVDNYELHTQIDLFGSTLPTAFNVGDPQGRIVQFQDQVGNTNLPSFLDAADMFRFNTTNGFSFVGDAVIDTTQPGSDHVTVELIKDANGNDVVDAGDVLASATSGAAGEATVRRTLAPGTYFLRVTGTAFPNYTVNFSGDLVPGFTAETPQTSNSRDIGTLTRQRLVSDGLGGGDVSDTYKFTMPHSGRLVASLREGFSQSKSPITGILAVDSNHNGVLDPGESFAQFDFTGALNKSLAAGTYFITLFDGFHFAYELTLTPDFAGETAQTARDVGDLAPNAFVSINDGFGANSPADVDFYKFKLSSSQATSIGLSFDDRLETGENVTITLFKDNGNGTFTQLQQAVGTTDFTQLVRNLDAGNYVAKLTTTHFYSDYTVGFSTVDNDDSIPEANFAPGNQLEPGTAAAPAFADFTLSNATDVDMLEVFAFGADLASRFAATDAPRTIAFDVDSRNGSNVDTFLRIFDSTGKQLAFNDNGAAPGETASGFSFVTVTLPAGFSGALYAAVSSAGNNNYNPTTGGGDAGGSSVGQYRLNVSFVAPALTGSIRGAVFDDVNGNGIKDGTETGIGGRTVWIDANNNGLLDAGERTAATDAAGAYNFTGVAAGTFKVREVIPAGWTQTLPTNNFGLSVTVAAGQNVTGKNFFARPTPAGTASIAGSVFHDFNRNGVRDAGDTGIGGWLVFIDSDNDGVLDSNEQRMLTDSSGNYRFINLAAGTDKVREVLQPGFTQTTPANNFGRSVNVAAGQQVSGVNFGVDN